MTIAIVALSLAILLVSAGFLCLVTEVKSMRNYIALIEPLFEVVEVEE